MRKAVTPFSFFILSALLFSSCYSVTSVQEKYAASIRFPEHDRKAAIVDRCRFYEYDQPNGKPRFTGRTYNYGALQCLNSAAATYSNDSVFDSVCVPYGIELKGSNNRNTAAAPMEWREAENICRKSKTDVLIVLEKFNLHYENVVLYPFSPNATFNSTANLNKLRHYERIDISKGDEAKRHSDWSPVAPDTFPDGSLIPHQYPVVFYPPSKPPQGIVTAETSWRVYDIVQHKIIGEVNQSVYFSCDLWRDPGNPYQWNPRPIDLYYRAADSLGSRMAGESEERWSKQSRWYYRQGSRNIRKGAKEASSGNWVAAATYWRREAESKSPGRKKTARACFNMALAAEKQGSVEAARGWLQKAHELGLQPATVYLTELQDVLDSSN